MTGRSVAHYRIDEEIGRGGMGVVYRAFDQKLHREVALKILQPDQTGGEPRERILAEARAASPLNHPSIATIYEVGEDDDVLYIAMEFVSGKTLRQQVADVPLRARGVAQLGARIAEALEIAHARKVLHGDIKPENIIVVEDGGIKLLDFGVARKFTSNVATTTTVQTDTGFEQGRLAGTVAYMAPERFVGQHADPRSDLFSLGVLLYEVCAGHRPFPGPDATSLVSQITKHREPRLDGADSEHPKELARIIHKLLEKDVETRYQTAQEVRVDLGNCERDLDLGPALSTVIAGRRGVAVLPFRLLNATSDDEYLSLALADAVINALSASDQLLLRPSSVVSRYSHQMVDPLVAARELNVDVVVEGSLQKLGPRVRAHVQVWSADDGSTLLSAKHDGETTDLFGLQDRIAESLFEALGVTADEQVTPPTSNPGAYELYLRANDRLSLGNRWDTRTAIEMLKSATELDPNFADAWARLGAAYLMMGFAFEPSASWYEKAEEAIERALSLDSGNAEARVVRGRVLWSPQRGFQNEEALRVLGEALRLSPGSYQARVWQSLIFLHVGLLEEAHQGLLEAFATEPRDPFTVMWIGQTLEFMGDYEESVSWYEKALAIDPSHMWANLFQPTVLVHRGELDRAERGIRRAAKLLGADHMLATTEALIWAKRGDAAKAESIMAPALGETKTIAHTHHAWHNAAAAYAQIGKTDEAVRWLRQAAELGLPNYPLFNNDPHLQPLSSAAGFRKLIEELRGQWDAFRRAFV